MLLDGQIVGKAGGTPDAPSAGSSFDAGELGLPTSERAIVSYLTNSYGGVGKKTAEALVEAFGPDIFAAFENEPERVAKIVPRRGPQVLAEWKADFERRSEKSRNDQDEASSSTPAPVLEPAKRNPAIARKNAPNPIVTMISAIT